MDLSIVIPAYNEKESIPLLCQRIQTVLASTSLSYEILVIDDGSTDGMFSEVEALHAKDARIAGTRLRSNSGKAAALDTGFVRAQGRFVITMDADLQDDPAEIPELISKLEEGYDLVSGWKKKRFDPIAKRWPSKIFNRVVSMVSGVRLHDFNCGLKAYRSEVTQSLRLYGQMHRYIPALAHWKGFRVTEKVVQHHPRIHGKSKYGSFSRMLPGYLDLMTIAFLHKYMKRPLHFFGLLGSIFTAAGLAVLGYFGLQWIFTGEMHIRPLVLLAVTSIILGIQFISLGFLGEMITFTGKREEPLIAKEL